MTRRRLPPLNALRSFEAFVRQGKMTGAADELAVTHGAISRQIRHLEEALGVALLAGPRNRPHVTEAGLRLAQAVTRAFDLIEEAAPPPPRSPGAPLQVSCLGTFAMKWLIPRLPAFIARHPDIQISISESSGPFDFRTDGLDLAIRMRPLGDCRSDDAEVVHFMGHFHGPVLAPGLADQGRTVLDGLARLPRLHTRSYPRGWAEWMAQTGVALPPAPEDRDFDHYFYMIEAAIAGLGVAIGPWPFVAREVESGRLVAPLGFVAAPDGYVALLPRTGARKGARTFCAWLAAEGASTAPPRDLGASA